MGHAVGQQLFTDLSNDLKGIMTSIGDHGDLIANTLSDNKAAESIEKSEEEETNKNILNVLQTMTSAISSGHTQVSNAINTGNDKVSNAISSGNEKVSGALTAGRNQMSNAITSGQDKVAGVIDKGQNELTAAITTGFDNSNKAVYVSVISKVNEKLIIFV